MKMILNLILLLASQYDCDPNRVGIVYGWNESWVFKSEAIAGDGLPPVGVACWAVEVLDWGRYCIDQSGPVQLAPRECIGRGEDRDRDGNVDLVDAVLRQREIGR